MKTAIILAICVAVLVGVFRRRRGVTPVAAKTRHVVEGERRGLNYPPGRNCWINPLGGVGMLDEPVHGPDEVIEGADHDHV